MIDFNILPVIGAIGFIFIAALLIFMMGTIKKEKIKSASAANLNSFAEEMKQVSEEMKRDLQAIKEKVEAIDVMMKDI